MSAGADDRARVSMLVRVPPAVAFCAFTEDVDQWWRRGRKYRVAGKHRSIVHIEGGVGGRLFESFETSTGTKVHETGKITAWDPPSRLAFEWRSPNYAAEEKTFVEVLFEESASGTLVTVTHSGWSAIRPRSPGAPRRGGGRLPAHDGPVVGRPDDLPATARGARTMKRKLVAAVAGFAAWFVVPTCSIARFASRGRATPRSSPPYPFRQGLTSSELAKARQSSNGESVDSAPRETQGHIPGAAPSSINSLIVRSGSSKVLSSGNPFSSQPTGKWLIGCAWNLKEEARRSLAGHSCSTICLATISACVSSLASTTISV